ncbi:MAG: septum formation initiator family protein [Solirubrobacterales bacterium]|jgi:cell division protein FtsB|nr:septum formation initiator family protein [Solirubrobacterales bacterium]
MASARSAQAKRRPATGRTGQRARPRVVAGGAGAARGIRWDRVGRVALLVVLVVIVFLYVGPARSYVSTLRESKQRNAEVAQLRRENQKLRARRDALRSPRALEREARRLGMVRPTERSYVVKNLPKGP